MSILTGMARARLALQTWLTEAQQAYADLMNEPGTTRPTGASPLLGGVAVIHKSTNYELYIQAK